MNTEMDKPWRAGSPRSMSIVVGLLALCLLFPSAAQAHDFEPERQLLVQVFPDRVDIMVEYLEAPGERSAMFSAQYLFGLGGGADEAFEELAKRAILPRMLDGLKFEVVGEQPRTNEPEVKIRHVDGRLMAAAMVTYDLPPLGEDERRTFAVHAADRSFLTTRTFIYGGEGLTRVDEPTGEDGAAAAEFFGLHRGQRWQAVFGQEKIE